MSVFYSASTGFFYDDQVCTFIPDDVLEIDAAVRELLLAQEAQGKRLICGPDNLPMAVEAPPQTEEELAGVERYWRSTQLTGTDGVVTRHRDEIEEGAKTTLTSDQYVQLQAYRRALRNWPEAGEFPLSEHRPTVPDWLSALTQ